MKPDHQYLSDRSRFYGVSIIVPVYNALSYACACIDRLYSIPIQIPFEVIVVDDGSAPDVRAWLDVETSKREHFYFISFNQNRGYASAVNAGASVACGNTLCLLNSDTLVTPGWLDRLNAALEMNPALGIVSPITNAVGSLVQLDPEAPNNPKLIDQFAADLEDDGRVITGLGRLTFFCVLLRQELWEKLGGLSEVYCQGYYEDDDFCLRTCLLNYQLGVVPSAFVFHYEKRSFKANKINYTDVLNENARRFAQRAWDFSTQPSNIALRRPTSQSITVIVPVVNSTDHLQLSLNSLLNQTIDRFEVVVVNGTQESLSPILSEYRNQLTLIEAKSDRSLPAAVNAGLQIAQGDVIAYLPAGAVYYPFHLAVLLHHLEERAIVCTGFAWHPSSAEATIEVSAHGLDGDLIWIRPAFPLVAWGHQRRCLETAPFWDLEARLPEWDWQLRLACQYKIARHRYVTCDAGSMETRDLTIDELRWMYDRASVWWDQTLLAMRHNEILNRQSHGAVLRSEQPSSQTPIECARQTYRWLIPYKKRLQIDRWVRRVLKAPSVSEHSTDSTDSQRLLELTRAALPVQASNHSTDSQGLLELTQTALPAQTDQFDILLFGVNAWDYLFQRSQHFASLLAKQHRIFFIEATLHKEATPWWDGSPFSEVAPNVFKVCLPSRYSTVYQQAEDWTVEDVETMMIALEQIDQVYKLQQIACLVHTPDWTPLIRQLQRKYSCLTVYDCLDDWSSFSKTYNVKRSQKDEVQLVTVCDLLVTTAQVLYDRWQPQKSAIMLLPNAADYKLFSQARPSNCLGHLASPIIGTYGSLDSRLDLELLLEVARCQTSWQFVFVGSTSLPTKDRAVAWWDLTCLSNVHVFPAVDQATLSTYLAGFDVCMIPFRDVQMTRAMNFVKLYEFLAAGKPVVAANLKEIIPFANQGLVQTYRDSQDFIHQVKRVLEDPPDSAKLQAFAAQHTWENRVAVLEVAMSKLATERVGCTAYSGSR